MKSSYDIIIWIFIFLLIALIIGLYISEKKRIPSALYMRTGGSATPYIEHFEQKNTNIDGYKNSSSFDVTGGASSKYGWGINDNDDYERNHLEDTVKEEKKENVKKCVQKKDDVSANILLPMGAKNDPMCTKDYIQEKNKENCNQCDILQHPDIDKYVLKSSVPACPKIDLNNYIKKSEIPVCPPKIDLSEYIKKSEVPAIPNIEQCPKCPEIPESLKSKKELQNTYQFNILDIKNLKNEDIKMLLKDERIKNYLDSEYEEKNNVPKPNNNQSSNSSSISNILSEESVKSNVNYNASSSLWDEVTSLFGIKKYNNSNKQSIVEEEKLKNKKSILQEEELKNNIKNNNVKNNSILSTISFIKSNKNSLEEEENKMIYNKDYVNQNFLKPMESNAMGLYAGDNLYASV